MKSYYKLWGAFKRAALPPKPGKSERPHEQKEMIILEIYFEKRGSLEPNREKLANFLHDSCNALKNCM